MTDKRAGESVSANIEEYAATAMNLSSRNEILSAMVVYGFLNYAAGKVHIPNKELMDEFARTIREKEDLGYINRLATESDPMNWVCGHCGREANMFYEKA